MAKHKVALPVADMFTGKTEEEAMELKEAQAESDNRTTRKTRIAWNGLAESVALFKSASKFSSAASAVAKAGDMYVIHIIGMTTKAGTPISTSSTVVNEEFLGELIVQIQKAINHE